MKAMNSSPMNRDNGQFFGWSDESTFLWLLGKTHIALDETDFPYSLSEGTMEEKVYVRILRNIYYH